MKTANFKKAIQILFYTLILITVKFNSFGQGTFINRVFQESSGSPLFNPILNVFGVQWSNSIKGIAGGLISVGYTSTGGQGQNVFLIKYDPAGSVIFQTSWNTSGTNNDYGIGLYEAANGDILVCGATDNGGLLYDVFVARFDGSGNYLNSNIQNGTANLNDVPVSIKEDAAGNILVAANTEVTPGVSDFWLLRFPSTLSSVNTNNYDYAGLNDIALGLDIDASSGNISLVGPSASSSISCDYAIAVFDGSSLAFLSDTRNNLPGTALDQALAFCKDAANNTYITGKAWNGTNFDIKTVKFNSAFALAWTDVRDPHGFNDAGSTIAVDGSGNIIVGGFSTKSNNFKGLICIKYSPSGSLLWQHHQASSSPSGDAIIKKVCTNLSNGDIYFTGVEQGASGQKQVVVEKINATGQIKWLRTIEDPSLDILPSDILFDTDGLYVISILDSVTNSYITTHYEETELDTSKVNYGEIKYKDGELIVRFKQSALNKTEIDNSGKEFGSLSDFLTTSANSAVLAAFDAHDICAGSECNVKVIKIFPTLSSKDSTQISRLGETVAIPDLWTALLLKFPNSYMY